jgi:AraC-like DNA-binding protein
MNHEITFSLSDIPYVSIAEHIANAKPFKHPDRILDFHVMLYITKGSISVIEEDIVYHLTPGSIFFLKEGLHHWGDDYCTNGTSWFYVHFYLQKPSEEDKVFQPYASHLLHQVFTMDSYRHNISLPKVLKLVNGNPLEWKLQQLASLFQSSNPLRAPYLNLLFTEILLNCYQLHPSFPNQPEEDLSLVIIQYLEQTINSNFHADELERYMNLSYKHLSALFKMKTGMTLLEYHRNLRMNEAARQLRDPLLSISEISDRLGFQDPLYFSNVFKKVHGVSPRHYRNLRF